MAMFAASNVQRSPFAIPVKRYGGVALVLIVQSLEVLILDKSRSFFIEQPERYLIFSVWFCQQILECAPVTERYSSGLSPICDLEKYGILFSFDFMLYKDSRSAQSFPTLRLW